jgi:hypothetical protein
MKSRLILLSNSFKLIPSVALVLTSLLSIGTLAAQAQAALTINNSTPAVTVEGTSGGNVRDASCAGFVADTANYTIDMTEDSDRRFRIKGNNETTLLILNSQGKRFCVQADDFSGGEAELPGRWKKDKYRVFIGQKTQSRSTYKLTILPIN